MRILFAFAGGSGHLDPLARIAVEARGAGHAVAFVARPWMVDTVRSAGFDSFEAGSDAGGRPERRPLTAADVEDEIRAFAEGFGRRIARERAAGIVLACEAFAPDVVVWEETDIGAAVAAERSAVPHASVLVTATGSFVRPELLAEPLNELRAAHGLPPDLGLEMLSRYLVLSPFPPAFRDPARSLPATAHVLRPLLASPEVAEPVASWISRLGDRQTVYVTLGTVFPLESGDLFHRVLAGVNDLPVDVVVTVGREMDPAELGSQPSNVRVERYVPQSALLPRCAAVVSHGGSGSVMGALTFGLPLVAIPMGADQPMNAARCEALGVGRALDALVATPAAIREAVSTVLTEPSYRRAAERIGDEIATLPGPEFAVAMLERLAAERRPIR